MSEPAVTARPSMDPVTFEVLKNGFATIADQMAEQILRTCHSFVIYCRDFSCAICDAEGNTIAQGSQDLAAHVGTLHLTAQAVINAFEGEIHEGDVYVVNDPFVGGTHCPDVRVIRPVFVEERLIAFAQANGHWADVGGAVPGSENFRAKDYFADGLRIPPVRIVDRGVDRGDVRGLITSNTRAAQDAEGDLHAQSEATRVGERELQRLSARYGVETVLTAFAEVQDYVERVTRAKLSELPDGTWETIDYLDANPGAQEGLVPVKLKMTIAGSAVTFDLTGSADVVLSNQNSGYGGSFSGVIGGMKMFFPGVPLNSGFFRPIDITLPHDSIVNAQPPAATSGFVMPYEKIMNSVIELWSQLVPDRAMACSFNIEYLEVGGWDRREGRKQFFMWYDWMVGGWGGRRDRDGASAYSAIFGAGLMAQPVEGQERLSPVLTTRHELAQDSGGPGKHRGGLGVVKGGRLTESSGTVISYLCDRERAVTWGTNGGLPSNPHGVTVIEDDVATFLGAQFADVALHDGMTFDRPSAGGGGMGDPLDRDPDAVCEDVLDEYVSVARAARDYGVILKHQDDRVVVDRLETEQERKRIRGLRLSWLEEDPEQVALRFRRGDLDMLDLVRQYGVILDWSSGELLPDTTRTFRNSLRKRSAEHWQR